MTELHRKKDTKLFMYVNLFVCLCDFVLHLYFNVTREAFQKDKFPHVSP
jgi:hypothetical protein